MDLRIMKVDGNRFVRHIENRTHRKLPLIKGKFARIRTEINHTPVGKKLQASLDQENVIKLYIEHLIHLFRS